MQSFYEFMLNRLLSLMTEIKQSGLPVKMAVSQEGVVLKLMGTKYCQQHSQIYVTACPVCNLTNGQNK